MSSNYINIGCDPEEWVRTVVIPRIERDSETCVYIFPDPLIDLERFAGLHSWYKHLRNPQKFYPILRIGNEPRNDICDGDDKDDNSLHWAFVPEDILFEDDLNGYHYTRVPFEIMKNHYVIFSKHLSRYSHIENPNEMVREFNKFTENCVLMECQMIQDRITRILLKIDPSAPEPEHTSLLFDRENKSDHGTKSVIIAGKKYRLN